MFTSVTNMTFLRHKGVQCYGIGPLSDTEDTQKKDRYAKRSGENAGRSTMQIRTLPLDLVATLAKAN
ncbi:MAG: hypothetical protein ABIS36_20835 [Chryseolinea sp.]